MAKMGKGSLAAAWRQGLKELGTVAAKPLPDSIQVDEPGQVWSVTTGEVTLDRTKAEPAPVKAVQKIERGMSKDAPEPEPDLE